MILWYAEEFEFMRCGMKIRKNGLYTAGCSRCVRCGHNSLFFGEKWLRDGWYYIPDRAIAIALGLCVFWQIVLTAGTFFLMAWIRKKFDGWMRRIIRIPVIVAAVFLFLFFAWNWFFTVLV